MSFKFKESSTDKFNRLGCYFRLRRLVLLASHGDYFGQSLQEFQNQKVANATATSPSAKDLPLAGISIKGTNSLPFGPKKSDLVSVKVMEPASTNKALLGVEGGSKLSKFAPRISSFCEAIQAASSPDVNLGFLANVSARRRIQKSAIAAIKEQASTGDNEDLQKAVSVFSGAHVWTRIASRLAG